MGGNRPDNWSTAPLRDCGHWYSGGTPNTGIADYWGGDIPWITASNLHSFYITDSERRVTKLGLENGTRLMPESTILFVVRGMSLKTEFRVGIAKCPVAFGQDCKAIIARPDIEPYFLANVLRAKALDILGLADEASHGTGRLQTAALSELEVQLPPLKEQQAIACILGALEDKIELNRRMNQTLEAMARAIFKSWFVDFDPVRAKAAGRQPPGLAPHIADLFPDAFEESELGEIPKGWRTGKIDDIADINARTLGRRDALDVIDYIEISEVMRGEVSTITRYARGEEPSRARRRLRHGDTVLSTVRPDRGAYFLCLNPADSLIASTGFAVLTPKDGNWGFLHALATRPEFGQELGHLADGGAYPAIRPEVVGSRQALIPNSFHVIAAFDRIAQPLFLRAEMNRSESRTRAAIRDALLPKLISGELRVADAERIAGRNL